MDACSVLIVGGGPAGAACAWQLRRSGLGADIGADPGASIDVVILDRAKFPRNKVCGGWITLPVFDELGIDPTEYARANVLQPITGFRTCMIGNRETETDYRKPISYGIRRSEFDDYLLKRSNARLIEGTPLSSVERIGDEWLVNGEIKTQLIVGAGGHFCPVARFMGSKSTAESAVAAQETEFEMTPEQRNKCSIRPEIPELYFCSDMRGYGWCFRKGNFINIGLGRLDKHSLGAHIAQFIEFLRRTGKITFDLHSKLFGHAYLLYGKSNRRSTRQIPPRKPRAVPPATHQSLRLTPRRLVNQHRPPPPPARHQLPRPRPPSHKMVLPPRRPQQLVPAHNRTRLHNSITP